MNKCEINIGGRYGKLLILEEITPPFPQEYSANCVVKHGIKYVKCICDCGTLKIKRWVSIKYGLTKSCGSHACIYGYNGTLDRGLSKILEGMKRRCYNEKSGSYKNYGGRGVVICNEWLSNTKSFIDWALDNGYKKGLQIDKDIKGNGFIYSPENCLFVTPKQNNRHKRNVLLNEILVAEIRKSNLPNSELARIYNTKRTTIYLIKKGKSWV